MLSFLFSKGECPVDTAIDDSIMKLDQKSKVKKRTRMKEKNERKKSVYELVK